MRLILFSLAISIHIRASMHVSQHCNAAMHVNNLDENDASRRFSSQLTPLQHQEHISIAAVCALCVNEGQKDRLLVSKGKKNKHVIFMHTS